MPAFRLEIDGLHAATIRCDDFHVVSADISGSLVDAPFATVRLTASTHPKVGESTYLIWLNELEIRAGQTVVIHFVQDATTTGHGRTIDELFPDEPGAESCPEQPLAERFREFRAKPKFRTGYSFDASTPAHPTYSGNTDADEFSFGFHALWNWLRPERASISLSSWTIDSVEFNSPSHEHFREYITFAQSASLRVGA